MKLFPNNTAPTQTRSSFSATALRICAVAISLVSMNLATSPAPVHAATMTVTSTNPAGWTRTGGGGYNAGVVTISGTIVDPAVSIRLMMTAGVATYTDNQFTVGPCPSWLTATIAGASAYCYVSGAVVSLTTSTGAGFNAGSTFSASFATQSINLTDLSQRTVNVRTFQGNHESTVEVDTGTTTIPFPVTIQFNANGGTGSIPSQTSSGPTALRTNTFTRTGFRFDGWGFFDGDIQRYADEGMYPFAQETDARTLFARWVQPTLRPSQSFIPATEGTAITTLVLTAENFTSPVTSFTLRSGSLPAGLTLTKTADYTAEISGTPTAEESGCFHFDATNGTESAGTASCIIISVAAAPEPPSSGGEDSDNSTPPANNDSATPPIGDNSLPNNVSPVSNTPASPAQAPSTASSGRTDTKVYSRKLPTTTQVDTTLTVLTKKASKTQMLRTRTPKVCVNLTQSVVLVKAGTCRLEVLDKSTKRVVRRLSTRVRTDETTAGTTVNGQDAISFQRISTRLSASARAQVAELATTAAEAKRVILIGHTASLTENNVSNNRIALQRAARVKAALRAEFKKAGVKVPISIVSVGSQAPISTKKSESRQTVNRRVEVYLIP